jgi:SNF2 family DNA or RNA helicase
LEDSDAQLALSLALQNYDEVVDLPVTRRKHEGRRSKDGSNVSNSLSKRSNPSDYSRSVLDVSPSTNSMSPSIHHPISNSSNKNIAYVGPPSFLPDKRSGGRKKPAYASNQAMFFKNKSAMSTPSPATSRGNGVSQGRGKRMNQNDSLLSATPSTTQSARNAISSSNNPMQFDLLDTSPGRNHTSIFHLIESDTQFNKEDKERRLQKLLSKTDQIIQHLSTLIKPVDEETTHSGDVVTLASERQPTNITGCSLRQYQLTGIQWLLGLHSSGLNGILADGNINA